MTSSSAVSNEKRFERAQRLMMAWLRAERADRVDAHCNGLGDVERTTWWLTADGERRPVRMNDGVRFVFC